MTFILYLSFNQKPLHHIFRTRQKDINPLSANPTKWLNRLKQFVGKLSTIFLSVFDHFVGLVLKGLINNSLCKIILPKVITLI